MEERVAVAAKLMESEQWNNEKVKCHDLPARLAIWAENVVKYWKMKHSIT